jgi:AhpD family alkylhydroperoxidase
MTTMHARIKNITLLAPEAMPALMALKASAEKAGLGPRLLQLVELRASQINGCSVCVDVHSRQLKKGGEADERSSPSPPGATPPTSPPPSGPLRHTPRRSRG